MMNFPDVLMKSYKMSSMTGGAMAWTSVVFTVFGVHMAHSAFISGSMARAQFLILPRELHVWAISLGSLSSS